MDQIFIDEFQDDFAGSYPLQPTGDVNSRPDAVCPNLMAAAASPVTGRIHSAWVDADSGRIIIGIANGLGNAWEITYEAPNIPVAHTGSNCVRHLSMVVDSSGNNAVAYEFHDSGQVGLWIYDERLVDGDLTYELTNACLGSSPAMMADKDLDILCFYRAADGRICWRSRANPEGATWGTEYEVDVQGLSGDPYPAGAFLVGGMAAWERCEVVLVVANRDAATGRWTYNYIQSAGWPLSIIPGESAIIDTAINSIEWAVTYEQQPEMSIGIGTVISGILWVAAYDPITNPGALGIDTAIAVVLWNPVNTNQPAITVTVDTAIGGILWNPVNTNQAAMAVTVDTAITAILWE